MPVPPDREGARRGTPLTIGTPSDLDFALWARRHAGGEVPSVWPYGLDGLTSPPGAARVAPVRETPRVMRMLARVPAAFPPVGAPVVTWDENALRLASTRFPHRPRYSGVIWATDLVRRNGPAGYRSLRRTLRRATGLWVLSRAQIDPLVDFLGNGHPPIRFVPFGIDPDFFSPTPIPAIDRRPMVLSAGNDRHRDVQTLLCALEEVHRRAPDARLVVQTRSDVSVPDGVEVLPRVSHARMAQLYRESSVVAIATRPNLHVSGMTVALEAMASSRPVVMTTSPGLEDYVDNGATGTLVSPSDADAFAHAVLALLFEPERRDAMGRAGRAAVLARATTGHLSRAIRDLVDAR